MSNLHKVGWQEGSIQANRHLRGTQWLGTIHLSSGMERQRNLWGPVVPRMPGPEGNLSVCSGARTNGLEFRSGVPALGKGLQRRRHCHCLGEGECGPCRKAKAQLCQARLWWKLALSSPNWWDIDGLHPEVSLEVGLSHFSPSSGSE